ncbi:hypothetical protein JIN84_05885 [Luteolibacter yonseiensis]|uniref:Uncharacterized protein n=1 Tax=Luteolibacter yonseiensis TaxID=1144680 RepID=A0A934R299_9BACT|nr:hypothetical protein [Luteolibacter yonseiensis]MBK1815132.1 hypothetical protein [Luteolibacter yonseiensis]
MPSPTDIANLALQHLGESRITSITDTGDKVSRTCGLNYPQARDEALQTAPWTCAKAQATLTRLSQAPLHKWKAAYQLPVDFIRLCEVGGGGAWFPSEYFDRMGSRLVLGRGDDETPVTLDIEYIFRQEDTSTYDPLLVECLALLLASKMARTLTGSDSKAQALRDEYERVALPRARTLNAQQIYSGKNHPLRQMLGRSVLGGGLKR